MASGVNKWLVDFSSAGMSHQQCLYRRRVWTDRPPRYWIHQRVRSNDRGQLCFKTPQSGNGIFDRIEPVLEDDLLRRVVEFLIGQPAPMGHRPVLAAVKDAAVPQQKRQQLLSLPAQVLGRRLAGANHIAHRLMRGIGYPHSGQLAGAQQSCPRSFSCRYSP